MQILDQFGIQPILLLAQIVNFLVLLFLLKKFLYRPILKILQERKDKIAKSLEDAREIENKLAQTEEDRDTALAKAAEEAKKIINDATKGADEIIKQAHEKAALDITDLVKKSEEAMKLEREQMHLEIRQELANLVATSLEKVVGKVLNKKDQEEIVKKSIKEIN
jgi:F-type H+-transporting ATPase subunit b